MTLRRIAMQIPSLNPGLFKSPTPTAPRVRLRWPKRVLVGVILGLVVAVLAEAARVLFGGNFHEVLPGRVYRSAQFSPDGLRSTIKKHGIRTIINLRGCCKSFDWYLDEGSVANELNVSMEDITLSATRLPAQCELRRLIEVLDRCEYPILFHCRQGADRTSLASAIALLLISDADVPKARKQLSLRFAHVPVLATYEMDRFLDMYEAWLGANRQAHSPNRFREWAATAYTPDPAPARLELLEPAPVLRVGQTVTLRLRATNLSQSTWEFRPGTCAGVHARYVILDRNGQLLDLLRAGRFEGRVPPGSSIDLALPLPPFHAAGRYRLNIDLADKNLNFGQLGSEWLDVEIKVE